MRKVQKTKTSMIVFTLIAAGLSLPVMANDQYYDTARVISVTPQFERVNTPQQSCQTEYVRESTAQERSPAGAIIGGIAGGLLGSQIGRGNGRVAAAAVGAGVGAIVGDRLGNNQTTAYADHPVERCVTVDNWQTVNRGYLVAYRYNGRDYTTVMDSDPGDTIRVNVAVNISESAQYVSPVVIERSIYNPPVVIARSNYYPPVVSSLAFNSSFGNRSEHHDHGNQDNHGRSGYHNR